MKPLLVISFYDRRPVEPLVGLLDSLDRHNPGLPYERIICVNSTGAQTLPENVRSRVDAVLERANSGMNIGAWDAGWRSLPGRPAYVFLQDECFVVSDRWLEDVLAHLDCPEVGMVGESFNNAWDKPWDLLRDGPGRDLLPEHLIGSEAANRVDVYLHHIRRHGIDPGPVARHLRSLIWGFRGDVLESIGGFVHGANYGECIAAEIGTARAVEARGLLLRQVGPFPFHSIRHREWNQDRPGGVFTHKPVLLMELQRLRDDKATLHKKLENPTWPELRRGLFTRLGLGRQRK